MDALTGWLCSRLFATAPTTELWTVTLTSIMSSLFLNDQSHPSLQRWKVALVTTRMILAVALAFLKITMTQEMLQPQLTDGGSLRSLNTATLMVLMTMTIPH